MQKYTHPVHTAKNLTTQNTCAGTAQTWLKDQEVQNWKKKLFITPES